MSIEGTIVAVMESWPLQVVVETSSGRMHVALRSDTVVTKGAAVVDPITIVEGVCVRIEGDASGADGIVASEIHLA